MNSPPNQARIEYIKKWTREQIIRTVTRWYQRRTEQSEHSETLLQTTEQLLLPYQIPHFYNLIAILCEHSVGLDASDTGTGKTYVALAIARILGLKPFIICPLSVIFSWKRAAERFGLQIIIGNYESVKLGKTRTFHTQNNRIYGSSDEQNNQFRNSGHPRNSRCRRRIPSTRHQIHQHL